MANVKFTGILKLSLDDGALERVRALWTRLPAGACPLSLENLHVTMVHQRLLRPFKDIVTGLALPVGPLVELDERVIRVSRPDRTSWLALVKNHEEMRDYIELFNEMLVNAGGQRVIEDRVFHVSLANLDGSPFASVGDVGWDDVV